MKSFNKDTKIENKGAALTDKDRETAKTKKKEGKTQKNGFTSPVPPPSEGLICSYSPNTVTSYRLIHLPF